MVYYTGDPHGSDETLARFCRRMQLTDKDILVILGDVGANYFGDFRDNGFKERLGLLKPTMLCIHGNHEMRPSNIPSFKMKEWCDGQVWYEEAYPNLLFAKDGEIFTLDGIKHLVIGGAYSVDKYTRLMLGYKWFPDEQPSEEIKRDVEVALGRCGWEIDTVLSHTCPYKYEPREAFIGGINQDSVDDSTERWLDEIEAQLSYKHWYCGHWHINKKIDKLHFLFHDFVMAEEDDA